MTYDVIILGGGAIGAGSAYELSKAGLKVLLLEKRHISSGASGASAAMLEFQLDANRGDPFFSFSKTSHELFPALHQEIKNITGIDFQYEQCGILQLALNEEEAVWLKNEAERQTKLGLRLRWIDPEPLQDFVPFLNPIHLGGVFYEEDGQVNGEIFTSSLIKAAEIKGCHIRSEVGSPQFLTNGHGVTGVKIKNEEFSAENIVVAAGAWTDTILEQLGTKLGISPIRGQLVIYNTPNNFLEFPIYTKRNGYVTPKREGYTLAGTTVEQVGFDENTTDEARHHITKMACELLPNFAKKSVRGVSAGLRPGSPDGLPFLGPLPQHPNVLVASGHYRNGILLTPVTAAGIRSLILRDKSPYDIEPFLPGRVLSPNK